MALIAFAQVISVGTALAVRYDQPQSNLTISQPVTPTGIEPSKPRTVDEILKHYANTSPRSEYIDITPHTPITVKPHPTHQTHTPQPEYPIIANARVERLVQEARKLHLEGDMRGSMLKLHEAERIDASEPAVIYQKGLLFEDMGGFTKAADHYQQIQQLGIKAGIYYRLSANKLTKGMDTRKARRNEIAIGPMKTRRSPNGKQSSVHITLLARPDKPVDVDNLEVQVHFYDKLPNDEIQKALEHSQFERKWVGSKIDWRDPGNEETLIVNYTIPEFDLADTHLLGDRQFYGCVVELLYKGEIIDQQASPRRLNSIHGNNTRSNNSFDPWLPSDNGNLLPNHNDQDDGTPPATPPLPSR